jgi:hypothetical protein
MSSWPVAVPAGTPRLPSRLGRTAVALAASAACGGALVWLSPSVEAALVAAIAVTCAVPLVVRVAQRRFDILEPLVATNVALAVMFVAQPAAVLAAGGDRAYKGIVIGGEVRPALALALLGVVCLQVGYALPAARRLAQRLPAMDGGWDRQLTVVFSSALFLVACAAFSVFLLQSGGVHTLRGLLEGRSSAQDGYFRHSTAYLYGAPQLIWPASLLLLAMGLAERRRIFVWLSALMMIPLVVFAGGQGARIILVPLIVAPAIYYFLARQRRPRPLAVAVAAYLLLTVGIAYFRDTRTAGEPISRTAELRHAVLDPRYELDQLVVKGTDNDMFVSLASELTVVPSRLSISPFDFVYRIAAKPIPHSMWSGKPLNPEEELTRALYPEEKVRASSSSGVIGSWYLGGGAIGVALGMLALGIAVRVPWEYWRRLRGNGIAQLMLTASLMFVPIVLRGGLGETFARALFGLVPLLIAARVCTRSSRPGAAT